MENIEMSAGSILSLFQTTKDQRNTFVSAIVKEIADGSKDAMQVHLQVKCIEHLIDALKENPEYKKYLLSDTKIALSGAKFAYFQNAKFEISEVGTKYDFSGCNDSVLVDLQNKATAAIEALKDRQEFLRKIPVTGIELINQSTGEIEMIYPASKTSTTIVKVTLK